MKNAGARLLGPHPIGFPYLWFHGDETVGSSARENRPFKGPTVVKVIVVLQCADLQRQAGESTGEQVNV